MRVITDVSDNPAEARNTVFPNPYFQWLAYVFAEERIQHSAIRWL